MDREASKDVNKEFPNEVDKGALTEVAKEDPKEVAEVHEQLWVEEEDALESDSMQVCEVKAKAEEKLKPKERSHKVEV